MPRKKKSELTTAERLVEAEKELRLVKLDCQRQEQIVDDLRMEMYAELAAMGTPGGRVKPPPRPSSQTQENLKFEAPTSDGQKTA